MELGKREMELLQKINFIRTCGTEEEKKAAGILADEVRAIGLEPTLETFEVERWDVKKALSPFPAILWMKGKKQTWMNATCGIGLQNMAKSLG